MRKQIAVIICISEKNEYIHIIEELKKACIPSGYAIDILVYPNVENRTHNMNNAIRETNAQYKIFFNAPVKNISSRIFSNVIEYFSMEQSVGVLGLLGSELPIDADYRKAVKLYGSYYNTLGEQLHVMRAENPLFYQQVSMIDFNFFATTSDALFDENLGDFFFMSAYCSGLKNAGLKTIVVMQNQNDPWVIFREKSIYDKARDDGRYEMQMQEFYDKYKKSFLPLVSILIPAYNNTYFLKQSLESAVGQDYPNIEIIVGDDSTNDDVKNFMTPYSLKYKNVSLYHHGRPLGGQGFNNINFLLNRSKGEYVKLLFHDDVLVSDSISEMMNYYIRDVGCKIGLISSVRDAVDENGNILGTVSPWIPDSDVIISGEETIMKILCSGLNFIGEYSTVLIRKKNMFVAELNRYSVGYYMGFLDKHMGDVSSWLCVAASGFDCVFLKKRLSYFRMHKNQNTYNNKIQVGSRLDWYALCMLTYKYLDVIGGKDGIFWLLKRMDDKFKPVLSFEDEEMDNDFKYMYRLYNKIHDSISADDREQVFYYIGEYIKVNSVIE